MTTRVTFWGVRGSIPTPGPTTIRYGGNTPCVALERDDRSMVVLDAGSGLRVLGHELMLRDTPPGRVELLLTHTHWDHIQGIPFFKPLSVPGVEVRVWGAPQDGVPIENILRRQMEPMVFPVPLRAFAAEIEVHDLAPGSFDIDGFDVEAMRLRHPGVTLGFVLAARGDGRKLAYVTDNELGDGGNYPVSADWRDQLVASLRGVDVLVHDAMYAEHMIDARAGWGHSTPQQAVELALEAGARRLVLFHHEPEHDDNAVDRQVDAAREHAVKLGGTLVVDAAVEGDSFPL
ncbi:MAG TPA: MBL fold metallo-hydrolase [Gemmatimonadales bacterium]|nr:MBL fold metallo-hydrolase [Gemmatimonadales bacterium]